MYDMTIFGHFCLDYLKEREEFPDYIRLGGTTVYASKMAKTLEQNVAVVSSVGGDFKHELIQPLIDRGIKIHLIESKLRSTAFVHEYIKGVRHLHLKSRI